MKTGVSLAAWRARECGSSALEVSGAREKTPSLAGSPPFTGAVGPELYTEKGCQDQTRTWKKGCWDWSHTRRRGVGTRAAHGEGASGPAHGEGVLGLEQEPQSSGGVVLRWDPVAKGCDVPVWVGHRQAHSGPVPLSELKCAHKSLRCTLAAATAPPPWHQDQPEVSSVDMEKMPDGNWVFPHSLQRL